MMEQEYCAITGESLTEDCQFTVNPKDVDSIKDFFNPLVNRDAFLSEYNHLFDTRMSLENRKYISLKDYIANVLTITDDEFINEYGGLK